MTFVKDSPVASRVVEAPDRWSRGGLPVLAIAIHMAQGGGTVSWLTRDDGNSSHYVVEYTGRVTQMVPESMAAGSMNPALLRTTDDASFTYLGSTARYGITALRRCLGAHVVRPNNVVIAIEVEGFAGDAPNVGERGYDSRANPNGGPNAAQRNALADLVADIRRRRGPKPCVGHRDQQSYKACPGKRIPWADYGGHAVTTAAAPEEFDMEPRNITTITPKLVDVPVGAALYDLDGKTQLWTNKVARTDYLSPFGCGTDPDGRRYRAIYLDPDGGEGDKYGRRLVLVRAPDSAIATLPAPATDAELAAQLKAALAAAAAAAAELTQVNARVATAVDTLTATAEEA
jgi:hypothetical protein